MPPVDLHLAHVRQPVHLPPVGRGRLAVVVVGPLGGPWGRRGRACEHPGHDPYGTPGAMARIALDIDSTLHHYWDLLERIALERYGVALPYAEQRDWGQTALERDAMIHCVEETHTDENIAAGVPYPGAVETVRRWHDEDGHWIHVTSHRRAGAKE